MGCLVLGILSGFREAERTRMIVEQLTVRGFEGFADIEPIPSRDWRIATPNRRREIRTDEGRRRTA